MAEPATGPISLPLENLRLLVAASANWQAWVEAADAEAAKRFVHLIDLPGPEDGSEYTKDDLEDLRPCAQIDLWTPETGFGGDAWQFERNASFGYLHGGKLTLDFIEEVPEDLSAEFGESKLRFMNLVGGVIADMRDAAGIDGMLSVRSIGIYQSFRRVPLERIATQGDFWRVQFLVEWGI